MCIRHRSPTSSGSQLSANPIVAGRWQPASGLFNSPNDIRGSWSALMITHSTSLHLHQPTRHRGSARAKRARLQSALVRICMPRLTDLSTDPRTVGVLHDLKDSVISHLSVETPLVPFSPKMQCRDDCFCTINIPPDAESTCLKRGLIRCNWEEQKQWPWMKWTEGWADVGCLKSRGVAQLDLCLARVFELLWLRVRERKLTKPHQSWGSRENMEKCRLLQRCLNLFKCRKQSTLFIVFKYSLFATSVAHNLVRNVMSLSVGSLSYGHRWQYNPKAFFIISTAYGGLDPLTLI